MSIIIDYVATKEDEGKTFEQLAKQKLRVSSGALCEYKYSNKIFINENPCRTIDKVANHDRISIDVEETIPCNEIFTPFLYELDIVYEDDFILVVNKPGNMESHPCHSNYTTTLGNAVAYYWMQNGEYHKYHIVNRLDKDTSGICIIAKNRFAHSILSEQMKKGEFKKYYSGIVHGIIEQEEGELNFPIGRSDNSIIKRQVMPEGKNAKTIYKKIYENNKYSLLKIRLETGRTHQIRVHFSHIGHPLVGDWLYGKGDEEKGIISRQALHCCEISFNHPKTEKCLTFNTEMPEEMKKLLNMD